MKKTIYVVYWEYNGGGGFDWYINAEIASKIFLEEKENEEIFYEDNWKVYFKELEIDDSLSEKEITFEIEKELYS